MSVCIFLLDCIFSKLVSLFLQKIFISFTSFLQTRTWNLSNYPGCFPKVFPSFSEHRSSFREVFHKSVNLFSIVMWRNIALLHRWSKSRRALHANLQQVAHHHIDFSKSLNPSLEQRYWKIHLDDCFWRQLFFGNIPEWLQKDSKSFSKAAAYGCKCSKTMRKIIIFLRKNYVWFLQKLYFSQ